MTDKKADYAMEVSIPHDVDISVVEMERGRYMKVSMQNRGQVFEMAHILNMMASNLQRMAEDA